MLALVGALAAGMGFFWWKQHRETRSLWTMRHIPGPLGLRGQTPEQDKKNESTM
jgi:hypothetical protein